VVAAAAAAAGFAATLGTIGSDVLWLVPLGDRVVHGSLPSSIPYATARSGGWHDVPAGGEVIAWALFHAAGGDRGLVLAQVLAAALGFGILARDLRREASGAATLAVAVAVLVGSAATVAVTNAWLFALALFPALLALVQADARAPSRRLWLAVPLLALWGNLNGSALAGLGLLAVYLALGPARRRPVRAAAILAAGAVAVCSNPALWHTPAYYRGVLGNEAARRGAGLWAPLGRSALDVPLAAAALLLVAAALRRRTFRPWEAVAVLGLAAATVHAARVGPWLLLVAAYPAARALRARALPPRPVVLAAAVLAAGAVAAVAAGPRDPGAQALARLAARTGKPVLAEPVLGQQVALAGGRVWLDNPIDAFPLADQRLYLDWTAGDASGAATVAHAGLVLVRAGSAAGRRARADRRLAVVAARDGAVLYEVRRR